MVNIKNDLQELKAEILRIKTQKKAIILAHNYQIPEIQELADHLGDSLELAKLSRTIDSSLIVFCGVRFMAETAKILSPEKTVLLPVLDAGCPLADTIEPEQLKILKVRYPDAWVVSYVNTSAEIKALSDVCCTSSNAVSVVKKVPTERVIFVPDKNLGWWVQKNVPEKQVVLWNGFCYVHEQFKADDVKRAKKRYHHATVMVHPECRKEVLSLADHIVSTAGMFNVAQTSEEKQIIVGTEVGMIERLQRECPNKEYFSLGNVRTCLNMKKTSLQKVYDALMREEFEVIVDPGVSENAYKALDRMVQYI